MQNKPKANAFAILQAFQDPVLAKVIAETSGQEPGFRKLVTTLRLLEEKEKNIGRKKRR